MKIRPLMDGESILQPGSDKVIQLRQRGTSDGNPNRMNQEAEQISPQARKLKQGGCWDQAVAMYTRCLELDPYNHWYPFQRAETFFMAVDGPTQIMLYDLAIADARYTIMLDPTCQPAWTLMIRCHIDSMDLEQAGSLCEEAIRLFPRGAERHDMFKGMRIEIRQKKQQSQNWDSTRFYEVADDKDSLYFFYSAGMIKEGHPEVLAVDLPYPYPCSDRIMKQLRKEKEKHGSFPFTLGTSIWIKKNKQWVSPIPVTNKQQRKQIFKHLMTKTNPKSKVVVLKVDSTSKENRPQPLTQEQAEAYIDEIVKNASQVQAMYNRGEKLVAESFITSFGSLSLGGDN